MIELTASFPSAAVYGVTVFLVGAGLGYLIRYLTEPEAGVSEKILEAVHDEKHKQRLRDLFAEHDRETEAITSIRRTWSFDGGTFFDEAELELIEP